MLGASRTPVLDAVGKLGDLGDRPSDKCTLSDPILGLMIRLADQSGKRRLLYILGTTVRSDGDYPLERIPLCLDSYYTLQDGR